MLGDRNYELTMKSMMGEKMGSFTGTDVENGRELAEKPKVLIERDPDIETAYICIANGKYNIISLEVLKGLREIIDSLKEDASINHVVFHAGRVKHVGDSEGAVPKISSEFALCSGSFSTGANVDDMGALGSVEAAEEYSRLGQEIMKSIQDLPQTTIAVIPRGYCVGGGLELSMSCRYRIASPQAIFMMPELALDIIPGWRGTQTLPRHIGVDAAQEWLLENRKKLTGIEAFNLCLVDILDENPLRKANSLIRNGEEIKSRSKNDLRKLELNGVVIKTNADESKMFGQCWREGTPHGITEFLDQKKKKQGM